jgi:hypothetical protein
MTINMQVDLSRSAAANKATIWLKLSKPKQTAPGTEIRPPYSGIRNKTGVIPGGTPMKVSKKALVPALALLALPTLALAQPPGGGGGGPPRGPQTPEQIEANFKQMDTNKDGSISKEEWAAAGRREQGFARFDQNGDGKITLEEMKAVAAQFAAGGGGGGGGGGRGPGGGAGGPPPGGQ